MTRIFIASLMLLAAPALAADTASSELAAGNTAFALELYQRVCAKPGNVFFSPFSISTALGMTWAGARGVTAEEMARTLHFGKDLHTGLAALNQRLISKQPGYELAVANRLFVQKGVRLLEPFTAIAKDQYLAPVEQVDFASEATRVHVNKWVEDQTNKRIKDLIPKGVFTSVTRLVLVNAIYFKGTWATEFDKKATTTQPFFTGSKEVKVPLMFASLPGTARVRHGVSDGVQVLELPYKGGEVTMVVMLPTARDGLPALEKELTAAKFERLIKSLRPAPVELWLPRFRVEQELSLSETLVKMGMPSAFGKADFSGINGNTELFISAVIHKAFVEVNEEGTEAAAATGVVMGIESAVGPAQFRADHPFLFALRDNKSGSVLFFGRVVDPQ